MASSLLYLSLYLLRGILSKRPDSGLIYELFLVLAAALILFAVMRE